MAETSLETEVRKFARGMQGTFTFSAADRIKRENSYLIKTANESVQLSWGNQPAMGRGPFAARQTVFRFHLKEGSATRLKIYPRDFLSALFSIFDASKSKSGNPQLDRSYLFLTNDSNLLRSIEPFLKDFKLNNTYESFVMDTGDGAEGTKLFTIQINALVSTEKDLSFLCSFGKQIAARL